MIIFYSAGFHFYIKVYIYSLFVVYLYMCILGATPTRLTVYMQLAEMTIKFTMTFHFDFTASSEKLVHSLDYECVCVLNIINIINNVCLIAYIMRSGLQYIDVCACVLMKAIFWPQRLRGSPLVGCCHQNRSCRPCPGRPGSSAATDRWWSPRRHCWPAGRTRSPRGPCWETWS